MSLALREALLNAVAHKDYASATPIQIRVSDDELSVWNPGRLPEDWTVERLLEKHPSRPFNPDVANVLFRAGLIESWGQGIERMRRACREAGTPEPVLREDSDGFWVVFSLNGLGGDPTSGETSGKTSGKIVDLIRRNRFVTIPELAAELAIQERSVERNLSKLQRENVIRRVGPPKGGHWEVVEHE